MSFYDDAKFMFLAGGAAGKDGKAYNIKPTNGDSYLSVNTDLSSSGSITASSYSLGWYHGSTQEGDSSIADNQITLLNASGEVLAEARASNGTNGNVAEVGVRYRLEYTVVENNSCTDFSTYNASDSPTFTQAPSTVGTHVVFIKNDNNQLVILRNSTENSSIVLKDIKVERDIDFTFERGTDLTATRVGKDGYIEKGREQLLVNTVWAGAGEDTQPTSWVKSLTADGTFDTTSTDGQLRFQAPTSSDRAFLTSPDISETGVLAQSVFVDAVDVVCEVATLMRNNTGASATRIGIFEDGVEVNTTENVKAGKRYTMVWNKTANTRFRFGIGCDGGRAGDITLSRPQLEYGLAATSYIENTSTSATAKAGVLEDEPRFDYTGGGCPALLIEGTKVNELPHSEYVDSWNQNTADVALSPDASPEGVKNAYRVSGNGTGTQAGRSLAVTDGSTYTGSIYIKKVSGADTARLINTNLVSTTVNITTEWQRFEVTATKSGDTTGRLYVQLDSSSSDNVIDIYGAQLEEGSYATSYIPTYGSSATRTYDDPNELTHGITMGTSCSVFFEGKHVAPDAGQISMLRLRIGTDTNNRLLIHGSAAGATTFPLVVQHKESGTSVNATGGTININESFKVLARIDGTTMDVFVNGSLTDTKPITATDIYDKISLYRTPATDQSGHAVKQAILFDSALSTNDSEIITGTSYSTFGQMASELSYTEYE